MLSLFSPKNQDSGLEPAKLHLPDSAENCGDIVVPSDNTEKMFQVDRMQDQGAISLQSSLSISEPSLGRESSDQKSAPIRLKIRTQLVILVAVVCNFS